MTMRLRTWCRRDGIDILIDLAGHTSRNRLLVFARWPAPVQATYLGYVNTTGLSSMDYLLADETTMPEKAGDERFLTERLLRLPGAYFFYEPAMRDVSVQPLPASQSRRVTFGCLNRLSKVTPIVIQAWGRILERCRGRGCCCTETPDITSTALHAAWEATGLAADRLEVLHRIPLREYFAVHNQIDIRARPLPAQWRHHELRRAVDGRSAGDLGRPARHLEAGASILTNVGLDDLIARSRDDYIERAVVLASDLTGLAELRRTLRDRMRASPLMDLPRFARHGTRLSHDVAEMVRWSGRDNGFMSVRQSHRDS